MRKNLEVKMYSDLPKQLHAGVIPAFIGSRDMGFVADVAKTQRMQFEFASLGNIVMSRTTSGGHRYDPPEDPMHNAYLYLVTTDRGHISEMRGRSNLSRGAGQSLLASPGPIPGVAVADDIGQFRTITTGIREDVLLQILHDFGYDHDGKLTWRKTVQNTTSKEGQLWSKQVLRFQDENFDGFATPGTMLPLTDFETCLSDYLLNLLVSLMLAEGVIDKRNVPDGGRAVQIVRTARAYMKSCYGAIATMKEVADACGITVRRLQQAFAEVENRRPHAALAEIRLDAANKSLFKMDPSSTVTEVALNCGFTHLGRFSGAFRQRFGRSPSEVHSGQAVQVRSA